MKRLLPRLDLGNCKVLSKIGNFTKMVTFSEEILNRKLHFLCSVKPETKIVLFRCFRVKFEKKLLSYLKLAPSNMWDFKVSSKTRKC